MLAGASGAILASNGVKQLFPPPLNTNQTPGNELRDQFGELDRAGAWGCARFIWDGGSDADLFARIAVGAVTECPAELLRLPSG